MSQNGLINTGGGGLGFRNRLYNAILDTWSMFLGAGRPSFITKGGLWTKDVSATVVELYQYDGANDVLLGTLNPTAHTWKPAGTDFGTYTPTLTNHTNVASSTAASTNWHSTGTIISAGGIVTIQATAPGGMVLGMSMPATPAFSSSSSIGGGVYSSDGLVGVVTANVADQRLDFLLSAPDTGSRTYRWNLTGRVN